MLKSFLPGKCTVAFLNRSASTLNGDLFAETVVPTFCKAVLGSTYSAGPGPSLLAYKSCRCNKTREITTYSQFRKHYCSCSVTPTVSLREAVNSFLIETKGYKIESARPRRLCIRQFQGRPLDFLELFSKKGFCFCAHSQ